MIESGLSALARGSRRGRGQRISARALRLLAAGVALHLGLAAWSEVAHAFGFEFGWPFHRAHAASRARKTSASDDYAFLPGCLRSFVDKYPGDTTPSRGATGIPIWSENRAWELENPIYYSAPMRVTTSRGVRTGFYVFTEAGPFRITLPNPSSEDRVAAKLPLEPTGSRSATVFFHFHADANRIGVDRTSLSAETAADYRNLDLSRARWDYRTNEARRVGAQMLANRLRETVTAFRFVPDSVRIAAEDAIYWRDRGLRERYGTDWEDFEAIDTRLERLRGEHDSILHERAGPGTAAIAVRNLRAITQITIEALEEEQRTMRARSPALATDYAHFEEFRRAQLASVRGNAPTTPEELRRFLGEIDRCSRLSTRFQDASDPDLDDLFTEARQALSARLATFTVGGEGPATGAGGLSAAD